MVASRGVALEHRLPQQGRQNPDPDRVAVAGAVNALKNFGHMVRECQPARPEVNPRLATADKRK
jgi:hypothetical protein